MSLGYAATPADSAIAAMPIEKIRRQGSAALARRIRHPTIEVASVPFRELSDKNLGTTAPLMREPVVCSAARSQKRPGSNYERTTLNGRMNPPANRKHCRSMRPPSRASNRRWKEMGLSARAHEKILRFARHIADLDKRPDQLRTTSNEAIKHRTLERILLDRGTRMQPSGRIQIVSVVLYRRAMVSGLASAFGHRFGQTVE